MFYDKETVKAKNYYNTEFKALTKDIRAVFNLFPDLLLFF